MDKKEFIEKRDKFLIKSELLEKALEENGLNWLEVCGYSPTGEIKIKSKNEFERPFFIFFLDDDWSEVFQVSTSSSSFIVNDKEKKGLTEMNQEIMKMISINKHIKQINAVLTELKKS